MWAKWIKGIISAAIGGAANTVAAAGIAPETFNFGDGLSKLGLMAGAGAFLAVANYLKQSPLPAGAVGQSGSARVGLLALIVFCVAAILAVGCAGGVQPTISVCDDPERGPSFICEKFRDVGVRVEDADLILQMVNLRLIKEDVYSKEQVLKFLDICEAWLTEGSISYRSFGARAIEMAGDYPELIVLSRYVGMLNSTKFISLFDRQLLLAHIEHQRELLE